MAWLFSRRIQTLASMVCCRTMKEGAGWATSGLWLHGLLVGAPMTSIVVAMCHNNAHHTLPTFRPAHLLNTSNRSHGTPWEIATAHAALAMGGGKALSLEAMIHPTSGPEVNILTLFVKIIGDPIRVWRDEWGFMVAPTFTLWMGCILGECNLHLNTICQVLMYAERIRPVSEATERWQVVPVGTPWCTVVWTSSCAGCDKGVEAMIVSEAVD